MLLQRLNEYAQRVGVPPPMYKLSALRYILVLNADGSQPHLIDCAEKKGKRLTIPERAAPTCIRTSTAVRPILFADHAEYTLGLPREHSRQESVQKRHQSYLDMVAECAEKTREPVVEAVLRYLQTSSPESLGFDLPDDFDRAANIAFEVFLGTQAVQPSDLPAVQRFWAEKMSPGDTSQEMQCLVCGERRPAVKRLPIKIRGIPGGQSSGMALISANARAFESYGLEESLIAPTCEACGHRFATALNILLEQPDTHLTTSSLAYTFWTKEQASFQFATLLDQAEAKQVHAFLTTPFRGKEDHPENLMEFYAAAFSASNARVVVRDWIETTVASAQEHLKEYFRLQQMVDRDGIPRWFPLWQLVNATVSQKSKEKPGAQVGQALLHLALSGGTLPHWILFQAVRSIRADREILPAQAALLKMVISSQEDPIWEKYRDKQLSDSNRRERGNKMIELDLTSRDPAYLCGRLLAELAEIQRQALGEINSGIVDRYYGTASSAPASIFGRLLRVAQPHMAVLSREKKGAFLRLDEQLQDILACFEEKQFPSTLDLMAQGRFALGFYQQRAANLKAALEGKQRKIAQQEIKTPPIEG